MAAAILTLAGAAAAVAQDPPSEPPSIRDTSNQLQDYPQSNHDLGNGLTFPDTDGYVNGTDLGVSTPYAKNEGAEWKQIGGALFPRSDGADPAKLVEDSPTEYDDNLYDVDFAHGQLGLAGGSRCEDPNPDSEQGCVPVLYRYTDTPERGEVWEQIDLPHSEDAGFVGAIAWIDERTAMAVGGTGTYPRREPPYGKDIKGGECPPPPAGSTEPFGANCDQAGTARAWLYRDGELCELDRDGDCPALPRDPVGKMPRGLTAIDFKSRGEAADTLGFAGGLGQIWRWQGAAGDGGGFEKLYDNDSPRNELNQDPTAQETATHPHDFRFRVRDIRFNPVDYLRVFAVTSGCCSERDLNDRPLLLVYTENRGNVAIPGQWFGWKASSGTDAAGAAPQEAEAASREQAGHQSGGAAIDSFYSLTTGPVANSNIPIGASLLATSASTDSNIESRSAVATCQGNGTEGNGSTPRSPDLQLTRLSTARLLSMDGVLPVTQYNCIPDWAVGELRSTAITGRGRRGLVVKTRTAQRTSSAHDLPPPPIPTSLTDPEAYNKAISNTIAEATARAREGASYRPTSKEMLEAHIQSFDYLTTSYTLNSVELVGDSGSGWAVGDHGAIARLGSKSGDGESGGAAEPPPPRLGSRTPKPLPDRSALGGEPRAGRAGGVPALRQRPREALPEPRVVNGGSPDATHNPAVRDIATEDVSQIVMSRDGEEGWAIGPNPKMGVNPFPGFNHGMGTSTGVASFYHYDGSTWTRCDPVGVPGQLAADPACASVRGLRRFIKDNTPYAARLYSIARVPLENDGYPANDDEFELVAVGSHYKDRERHGPDYDPVIVRYRQGHWDFEEPAKRAAVTSAAAYVGSTGSQGRLGSQGLILHDVAFTAPDDGWALGTRSPEGTTTLGNELYHFDGDRWLRCRLGGADPRPYVTGDPDLADCGSPRLPSRREDAFLRLISAGDRVYIYGTRPAASGLPKTPAQPLPGTKLPDASELGRAPMILFHERGGEWTDGGAAGGGFDPGWNNAEPALRGTVKSLSVAQNPDGTYAGWAVGRFYRGAVSPDSSEGGLAAVPPAALLMRLGGGDDPRHWSLFKDPGALEDHLTPRPGAPLSERWLTEPHRQATLAGGRALVAQPGLARLHEFKPSSGRWEMVHVGRPSTRAGTAEREVSGQYQAVAPDGKGGFWFVVKNDNCETCWGQGGQIWFEHYTDRPQKEVFEEAAQPFGDQRVRLTSLAGAPDGSVWASTDSSIIARYDRVGGWKQARIPGWDPGRVVTASSEVNAVAMGADGSGVAVGKAGRIANLTPTALGLDGAAGVVCRQGQQVPGCGTSRDLRAAAVAPDGSALAGGDAMTLLWRAPGQAFQRLPSPPGGTKASITGITMPSPDRAWITTETGFVISGEMSSPGIWRWENGENRIGSGDFKGKILGSLNADTNIPLRSISINRTASGYEGYAVGDYGLVLRRDGDEGQPWRRLRAPGTDHLKTVTMASGSREALIGGQGGVVLTASGDSVEVARPAGYRRGSPEIDIATSSQGPLTGPVVGAALLPGTEEGESEAWIAIQERGAGTNRLLHYASDPDDPLLNPDRRAVALPDAPPRRDGELAFAAFGKSDCESTRFCPEMLGTSDTAEVVNQQLVTKLKEASGTGAVQFSLFSGDATDSAGQAGASTTDLDKLANPYTPGSPEAAVGALKHRRFNEFVADPLRMGGIPFFGAIGSGDLSRPAYKCPLSSEDDPQGNISCRAYGPEERAKSGDNIAWREGLEGQAAPWGVGGDANSAQGLEFKPAGGSDDHAEKVPDATVDPDGADQELVRPINVRGGARTHYAADVIRNGDPVARIVTVDSSLRGLTNADGAQHPLEKRATGQLSWLEHMLCFEGQTTPDGDRCTRKREQQAIVLSNTPTYSYGPADPDALATDGSVLEALFFKYRVNAVVHGRLGWNGLYYALAPGLHAPCVGDSHPEHPPAPGATLCSSVANHLPVGDPGESLPDDGGALDGVEDAASAEAVCKQVQAPVACDGTAGIADWMVPFVVASGGGGKFGPNGDATGSAAEGYWHGYTVVRLSPDGDPRKMIVEQRPLLDWITIRGATHVLRPRQRTDLRGFGREPITFSMNTDSSMTRYAEISTAAVTHRFDILLADPEKPWLPKVDEDSDHPNDYVPVPSSDCAAPGDHPIGCIDRQSGAVRAGSGGQERTHALATLSVGDKIATWPLVFEPRPSFSIEPPPPPPSPPPPPPPPPPAAQPPGQVPTLNLPTPPALPGLPLSAELQPPQPPIPPPPAAGASVAPLNLFLSTPGINIAPQSTVVPPPAPPIQPAPPGGARKEARQRQAAAQKSGSDVGDDASSQAQDATGDLAGGRDTVPGASEMTRYESNATRLDRRVAEPSYTIAVHRQQPSAWVTGLQWGGGMTLMGLVLAFGWITVRPTPRRRQPELPAPAFARTRRR